MSYNEHTWQTGETITAEKLNNLEGGVQEALESSSGGEIFIVTVELVGHISDGSWVEVRQSIDKTREEIATAIEGGKVVIFFVKSRQQDGQDIPWNNNFVFGTAQLPFYIGTKSFKYNVSSKISLTVTMTNEVSVTVSSI